MTSTYEVHSTSSIIVRPIVLRRAEWATHERAVGPTVIPGTWYAHVVRGRDAWDVAVIPFIGCPLCGKKNVLVHNEQAAAIVARGIGQPVVPVTHTNDHLGKVSPDVMCMTPGCSFHRQVYLDRWNKTKPLYAIAYTRGQSTKIEIAYSHSIDAREARIHLGVGDYNIIGAGPAIGFFVNERTGRMTTD